MHELVFADDTLLIDVLGPNLQHYMDLIVQFGSQYGLSINWKKVEIMTVRCDAQISSADGKILDPKASLAYLGATIHNSGVIDSELNRRLGMASQDFKALKSIWNHTNLSCLQKFAIYRACICSKLFYGLQSV